VHVIGRRRPADRSEPVDGLAVFVGTQHFRRIEAEQVIGDVVLRHDGRRESTRAATSIHAKPTATVSASARGSDRQRGSWAARDQAAIHRPRCRA